MPLLVSCVAFLRYPLHSEYNTITDELFKAFPKLCSELIVNDVKVQQ